MQKNWIAAPLLSLALISPNLAAQTCETTNADKTTVADTVRALYAAGTVSDMEKMRRLTAPSFYIFDNGHQYSSIDDLMNVIKAFRDQGVKFVWNVTNPRVTIHCNDAWVTWVNDGSVQMPNSPAPTPTQWLESAILEKQDGAWKVVFMHSTRVPPAAPPAK